MVSLLKIVGLAVTDAVNPCALAVMVIVLMTLLLQDPNKKKKVLMGGLMFTLAVFILYFLYGLIMVKMFSFIPNTGNYSYYLFKGFGIFAIILGILNLKDYFVYKPGSVGTEMPLSMRPRMKMLIKKITGAKGAFIVGLFVTLFLLPCTIGPYIIASAELSSLSLLKTALWLLFYNFIFVLPMIIITFAIYYGITTVDNVSGWKERNIKKLHLIEGLILTALGILMFTGVI
jgi:cytochrome c biogenesis protein CcdA